jgi:peptidyl-prolyl cis-trans isomerase C
VVKKSLVLFVLCLSLTIVGCDVYGPPKVKEPKVYAPPIKGMLLAQVDDWSIGTQDFREQLESLKTLYPKMDVDSPEVKKTILQELVSVEILAKEAERKGLDKEPDVLKAIRDFKRTLLFQRMLEDIGRGEIVTDVEVRNFYDSNKLNLRDPEERRVREIVVSTETEAKDILVRLLQGESFSRLASSYSKSASRSEGGDLGYIMADPTKKFTKFWDEAFSKGEGETSSYFKGPDGYYIIKVEDIRGGKVKSLSEVRSDIEKLLRQMKIDKKKEDIIFDAKQRYNIVINENLLD